MLSLAVKRQQTRKEGDRAVMGVQYLVDTIKDIQNELHDKTKAIAILKKELNEYKRLFEEAKINSGVESEGHVADLIIKYADIQSCHK